MSSDLNLTMEEKLAKLEKENKELKEYIKNLENKKELKKNDYDEKLQHSGLTNEQISRFSRHLILPDIGIKGQEKICKGSILVVGAGGLGSPCLLYLAAAGVGRIGIADFDVVDKSNLHRQVIHTEDREGISKVLSAKMSCLNINSKVKIDTYEEGFNEKNGLDLVSKYDVVIDASDNVKARYLVNDACVLLKKPLVSGSSVRMEGQLTVYNHNGGPCYRCLFPDPPPPETVTNCSDGGVFGVVHGVIGTLQALESLKILMGMKGVLSSRMLTFSGTNCTFRNITLRSRKVTCQICGDKPSIKELIPYEITCKKVSSEDLETKNRITCQEYKSLETKHYLLDVRASVQYEICSLKNSVNIPLDKLPLEVPKLKEIQDPIYVICRRGVASVQATKLLLSYGIENIKNIDGGLTEWKKSVDEEFPLY